MTTAGWTRYLGIPFLRGGSDHVGADCWGLVRLVYRERYRIELPDPGPYDDSREAMLALVRQEMPRWRRVEAADEGDVALFYLAGAPVHVGVCVAPNFVLHVSSGHPSRIDRLDSPLLRGRLEGVYRWIDRPR